jgi:hypothetical protein
MEFVCPDVAAVESTATVPVPFVARVRTPAGEVLAGRPLAGRRPALGCGLLTRKRRPK